jgi:two-component system sensor histidine kinase KdpD
MVDAARGNLRIYLGAAPGVGKTYAMLSEGHRRADRGTDVVVAYVEHHARPNTLAMAVGLEAVPRAVIVHRDRPFEEMDLDAVLARRPKVALVDELAHTNVPGSRNEKRWQDVEELLQAGIDVISTVNVQHLESLNDVVERITGVVQRETVPDHVVRAADQVELVDMTPEALRRRMAHGNIYGADKVDDALANYFRVGNLTALRELALMWLADKVDDALTEYQDQHGIDRTWETRERVVVALTGAPSGEHLIRRAGRIATRARGELLGVHIRSGDGLARSAPEGLDRQRTLLTDLGGAYHEVVGDEVAAALVQFARAEHATQIVLGATQRSRWTELWRGSVVNQVVRASGDLDVHVISRAADDAPSSPTTWRPELLRSPLTRRRRAAGWLLGAVGLPLLTFLLVLLRDEFGLPGDLMAYVLLVVAVAAVGGTGPGLTTAVASGFVVNWYLTEPYHTLTISEPENTAALLAFVLVGIVVSLLVSRAERRAADARRASGEAEALARVAAGLALSEDPLPSMLDRVRTTFQLESAALYTADADGWHLERGSGTPLHDDPADATVQVAAGSDAVLALTGPVPTADDRLVLSAFAAQLAAALEQRRLRAEAAEAEVVAEGDALRTALLRAVSHDLRTPLASIKASVSSLLQDDVPWTDDDEHEFLLTIDEETDRLNRLVGNLLDMSRLQTGVLQMVTRAVGWEEVVAAATSSIAIGPGDHLVVDVPETLPPIAADPALLERSVANVVANALRHGAGSPVELRADAGEGVVHLTITDHGPGVAADQHEQLFEPFQRLGDTGGSGVGLGLAVAHGFVNAMGGSIRAEDTPGGGLTLRLTLPAADAQGSAP